MVHLALALRIVAFILATCTFVVAGPRFKNTRSAENLRSTGLNGINARAPNPPPAVLNMQQVPNTFTWTAYMPPGLYTRQQALTYAEKAYVQMQTRNPSGFETDSSGHYIHTTLLACLFVPKRGFFLGTAPGLRPYPFNGAQAPAWNHHHAEDVVEYNFEASLPTKLSPGDQYPLGSFIAIVGHFGSQEGSVGDRPADSGRKFPCGMTGASTITPSCFEVAYHGLGIKVQ